MNFLNLDKTWIIAEIGVNHEGDFNTAAELIKSASECGVDAVKFQTYSIENYISTVQLERYERTSKFQLSYKAFRELSKISNECGITFFSTPMGFKEVDFLDEIAPIFKISSGDLTHLNLIRHVASKMKPMIISTGLGTKKEIQEAIDTVLDAYPDIREKGELVLLHCVSTYPTRPEDANIANIRWMQETYNLPVGYSDHTVGAKACELAVASGAVVIEKHFTYRKEDQAFHDHVLSADPEDMRQIVLNIREAESYMGSKKRIRGASENKMLLHMRRSVGAVVDIPAGEPVKKEWLTYLRPAWGLRPDQIDGIIGKRLNRNISAGDLIHIEDVES